VPYVFVTNGTHSPHVLRERINKALDINITNDHIIAAQTPCANLKQYHDKRVLLCCQNDGIEAARE
jgi:ribonucleotide monophosphatase NagD (HAD superfamily)